MAKDQMQYITINNYDNFQAFKDGRKVTWLKLLIEIIDKYDQKGTPKKYYLMSDIAKLTFIHLLCLQARYEKIPFENEAWLKNQLGIQKINLQPLVNAGFITITSDLVQSCTKSYENVPEREKEREKEREIETGVISLFEEARILYPNSKRGYSTELKNFQKHKDWKEVLPLLKPAIEKQIAWRANAKGEFRPAWKNFQGWITQRCWEFECDVQPKPESPKVCLMDREPATHEIRHTYGNERGFLCDGCWEKYKTKTPPCDNWGKPIKKKDLNPAQIKTMIEKVK